jgi:diadenosine tetraphosphate (Ap4A) HIT family hydrolase
MISTYFIMRILEKRRAQYKRRYHQKGQCDFCDPKVIKDQGINILESGLWRVLACKYPYMNGNLMITPKRHVTATEDLDDSEWAEFPSVLAATQKLLGKLFKTKSFNLALNLGPNSGGTIRHLHLMIVPRPKKLNLATFNVFHDFYLVQMDYKELLKRIRQVTK